MCSRRIFSKIFSLAMHVGCIPSSLYNPPSKHVNVAHFNFRLRQLPKPNITQFPRKPEGWDILVPDYRSVRAWWTCWRSPEGINEGGGTITSAQGRWLSVTRALRFTCSQYQCVFGPNIRSTILSVGTYNLGRRLNCRPYWTLYGKELAEPYLWVIITRWIK